MKKFLLSIAAVAAIASASALPKAFYVKQGDNVTKYNFGVAEDLVFSDGGRTLSVRGYGESINLEDIDYISFTAPLSTALTPSAQKQKLIDIGHEAYTTIDLNDNADILMMVHEFFDGTYDGSDNWIPAPVEYYIDPSYYDVHGEFSKIVKALKGVAGGDAAAMRLLKAKVVNLYKIEDYFGVYTADAATCKWVKTAADHFEIRFTGRDGNKYAVRLDASADYTTWDTSDFKGRFPRTIDITVSKNNTKLASAKLATVLVQNKSINMTLDFEANGYVVKNVMAVTDNNITDDVTVTVKGKQYVTAHSTVEGRNFVNYDVLYDAVDAAQGYYDDETHDWVDGDADKLVACFSRASSTVDLLGKLRIKGKVAAPSKIYNTLSEQSFANRRFTRDGVVYESYDGRVLSVNGGTYHVALDVESDYDSYAACLNDYTDAGFYYDGEAKLQGYLGYETGEEIVEGYSFSSGEQSAYTVVEGLLMSVYREVFYDYDPETHEPIKNYGPWTYTGVVYDENGKYVESREVEVKDSEIVHPAAIYHHSYKVEPLLLFPDQTSFAIVDFFDENSFSKLIDDYNDIIDTYLGITGQNRDESDY